MAKLIPDEEELMEERICKRDRKFWRSWLNI